jgi:hypothetical protein
MCKTKEILYNCDNGYLVYCSACETFSLGFGTNIMCIHIYTLIKLKNEFNQILSDHSDIKVKDEKSLIIATDSKSIHLLFTYKELENVQHIILQGLFTFETIKKIKDDIINY